MLFAVVFFINAAANFVLGLVLSALLGPAEFGRFATVALSASTLATALFDWLRLSAIRFSGGYDERQRVAASLDAGYIAMIFLAVFGLAAFAALRVDVGLSPALLALTPFMAIAYARSDYAGAQMRARDQGRAFAALAALRHGLTFTIVLGVAAVARSAGPVISALTATTLISVVALGSTMRTPGASLNQTDRTMLRRFVVYAKPIVVSTVTYQLISLVNRHVALDRFGASATGELALATDLGFRLFLAINVLPETLLFQYALSRERDEDHAAAERQIGINIVLVFAVLAPLTAGYMAMAPTFEALVVPAAYRGEYARLSLDLAPGFLAFCALYSMANPVFQLAKRTWPLTLAALAALALDLALVRTPFFGADIEGLAQAQALSFIFGFAVATTLAGRASAIRPSWRDMTIVGIASGLIALAVHPLNALRPHILAAGLGVAIGGAILAVAILAFDVAGLRAGLRHRLASLNRDAFAPRAQS
jgi:O-antigen/teichoic acid export membrane protein